MLENKLFEKDIYELYDMDVNDSYELVSNNTNYLDNISIDEVLDIKFSCYQDVIILLSNGIVIVNGEERYSNIKSLAFMSGLVIFAISNDNEIICIVGSVSNTRFMCNNNYKYKKIIVTPLVIVALNDNKEIKVFGTLVDYAVDYKNYFDVDDILCIDEEIIVVKGDRKINLFSNKELVLNILEFVCILQSKDFICRVNDFNFNEDKCLDLWVDLSDAVQRSLADQEMLNTSFGDLIFMEDEQDVLKISEGNDVFVSLLLLLKALYVEVKYYDKDLFVEELKDVEKCFYLGDELRIVSDDKNSSLISILKTGIVSDDDNSSYACCYRYYQGLVNQHARVREVLNGVVIQLLLYKFSFNVKVM